MNAGVITSWHRAVADGIAQATADAGPFRITAEWPGGGFGFTKAFPDAQEAAAWGVERAKAHPGAVVIVEDRETFRARMDREHGLRMPISGYLA